MSPGRPGIPRAPMPPGGVPLERGRATALLGGLLLFGAGFALAAAVSVGNLAGGAGSPLYLICVTLGFVGVGVVGFFLNRGTVPLPEGAIWSPIGLRALARALGLPVGGVMALVYGLIGLGVLGNVVVPLLGR